MPVSQKPRKKRSLWASTRDGSRVQKTIRSMFLARSREIAAHALVLRDYPLPSRACKPLCIRALEQVLSPKRSAEITGLRDFETEWVLNTAESLKERLDAQKKLAEEKPATPEVISGT